MNTSQKKLEVKKDEVDLKTSILIGLAQGLAALPGFSRSGWTIATGLFCGLDRVTAARYSFLKYSYNSRCFNGLPAY